MFTKEIKNKRKIVTAGVSYKNNFFHRNGPINKGVVYYRCSQRARKCKATLNIDRNGLVNCNTIPHNHEPIYKKPFN